MKAVILARVSTKEQEEGYSLDAQIDKLRQYSKRNNFDVLKEFRITESSTKGERKEFNEMLNFASQEGRNSNEELMLRSCCNNISMLMLFWEHIQVGVLPCYSTKCANYIAIIY